MSAAEAEPGANPVPEGTGKAPERVVVAGRPGRLLQLASGEVAFVADPPAAAANGAAHVAVAPSVNDEAAPTPRFDPHLEVEAGTAPPPVLRSEGLQEIIEVVPGWLARWGISAITAAVLVLLALASIVRFPVIVSGTVSVTTPVAPVRLAAPAGGEIQHLLVRDGQTAAAGAVLAVLRSPADYRAVLALKQSLSAPAPGALPAPATPTDRARLGDVLEPLSRYEAARTQHAALAGAPLFPARIASLRTQIERQRALFDAAEERMALLRGDVELAARAVDRSNLLVQRELLSRAEAEQSQAVLLGKRHAVENGRGEVLTHQMRLAELEGQLLDVEQARAEQLRTLQLEADKALSAVYEAITQWESRYLLRAPANGEASFFRRLGEGQYVAPGEPLIAVVFSAGRPVAVVRIGDEGVGRVHPGQRVVFRFTAYPYQEYGTVEGIVQGLSLVASEADAQRETRPEYLVSVSLPNGLRSSHGNDLALRQEMGGTAEIIAEDRSLLHRLLSRLTVGLDRVR